MEIHHIENSSSHPVLWIKWYQVAPHIVVLNVHCNMWGTHVQHVKNMLGDISMGGTRIAEVIHNVRELPRSETFNTASNVVGVGMSCTATLFGAPSQLSDCGEAPADA